MKNIYVFNSQGEKEPFSFNKVYQSAKRVGASDVLAEEIARKIEKEIFSGIKTSEIFKKVERLLSRKAPQPALKFSLKKAIAKLGPTGFIFERYIGEIFSRLGFEIKYNQNVSAFCCHHYEIDLVAKKDKFIYIIECKYRGSIAGKVHCDVALANYARFLDIKKGEFLNGFKGMKLKSLIITNARFTDKAVDYSECVGVELLGWKHPRNKGLESLIEDYHFYPITILPSLSRSLADIFVKKNIILTCDILRIDIKKFARKAKISSHQFERLKKEANVLFKKDKTDRVN